MRYYDYDEDRLLTFAGLFADAATPTSPARPSSDGFSPRVILAFEANDDVQFTAQVARGFRLGGINDPLNVDAVHGADDLVSTAVTRPGKTRRWNYELGAKTQLAGGRVTFNAAVFYSDIDGSAGRSPMRAVARRASS